MTPTRLDHLAIIRITGADRIALVQGQSSNDARKVDPSHAQLTSFSNPKGRCYAICMLAAHDESLLLATERSVAPALAKKLAMYVLRSKAKVELAEDLAVCGSASTLDAWASATEEGTLSIGIPDSRSLRLVPRAAATSFSDGSDAWRLADIAAGIPTVTAETAEHFVPLWLGLERFGAIDFKKGCYTGQEIVARSHYLGQTKQQLYRARCSATAAPGTKLYAGTDQSIGEVAISAPDGVATALLLVARDTSPATPLSLGAVDGPRLTDLSIINGASP